MLPYAGPGAGRPDRSTAGGAVVIGLLAATAGLLLLVKWDYRFSRVNTPSKHTDLVVRVQSLRAEISLFKLQHDERLPGVCPLVASGGPFNADPATFWGQMTQFTDSDGNTSPAKSDRYCFGPYLKVIQINPLNGSKTIASAPGRGVGFVYDYAGGTGTGRIWGVDESGALYPQ